MDVQVASSYCLLRTMEPSHCQWLVWPASASPQECHLPLARSRTTSQTTMLNVQSCSRQSMIQVPGAKRIPVRPRATDPFSFVVRGSPATPIGPKRLRCSLLHQAFLREPHGFASTEASAGRGGECLDAQQTSSHMTPRSHGTKIATSFRLAH